MPAVTKRAELFDPRAHVPLTERVWDADCARTAIGAIVAETERAFTHESLWPPHPLDQEEDEAPLQRPACLYLGAAGVIWALHEEEWLLEAVRANVANPTLELMWGSPGTMLAAQVMHERTGAPVWSEAWTASADHLWAAWDGELWRQNLRGRRAHVLGPAHGFVGNVFVLGRGELLDGERRGELKRRAISVVARHARRVAGLAQWPTELESSERPLTRTQWCHGAPGIVAAMASLAPNDDGLTELLLAGGELTWHAGPLEKGANLCHGTAGNGYAFLKLFARTGDELWLHRARAFAMHAIEQVERSKAHHGRGRHTLWTGDPGTALYLASCITATAAFPTLDSF